jgi:Flp pilus assembly secretin CpaC
VAVSLALTAIFSASGAANAASGTVISVNAGASKTIQTPGLTRVAIGDKDVAGVVPIGTSQVLINGKSGGETTLLVWEGGREYRYIVDVSDPALDDIAAMVRAAISEPNVRYVTFPHALIVRGTVADRGAFHRLVSVLARFDQLAKAQKFTLVNAVTVGTSPDSISRELAVPGAHDLSVEVDASGNLIVSGTVETRLDAEKVLARAQALAGSEFSGTGKLVDRLTVTQNTQIDIKVYVLEVDNTATGNLGLSLQSATQSTSAAGGFLFGTPSFPVIESGATAAAGKGLNIGPWVRTTLLAPTLNLLMQTGHARILSSPDLVATSGASASFLVGGQIPYIYSAGLGQVSVVFKDYGVNLKITPTLLPNGAVAAEVDPDISDLDYQDAVNFGGYTVPALTETRLSTHVIATDGQSIVMGGLLRRINQQTIQKIPLLSSIPILGKLFQSTSYQRGDTNVIFVMTPTVITTK